MMGAPFRLLRRRYGVPQDASPLSTSFSSDGLRWPKLDAARLHVPREENRSRLADHADHGPVLHPTNLHRGSYPYGSCGTIRASRNNEKNICVVIFG